MTGLNCKVQILAVIKYQIIEIKCYAEAIRKISTSTNRLGFFFPPINNINAYFKKALLSAEEHDAFSM